MANKYCNLDGSKKIKDEYQKINIGFDKVEEDVNKINDDINALDERVDEIITTPADSVSAQEIIDARGGRPTLGKRFENIETAIEELNGEDIKYDNTESGLSAENVQTAIDDVKDELDAHKAENVSQVEGVHGLQIEKGVFTPTLEGSSVAGNHTYSVRKGKYKKIGSTVICDIDFTISTLDKSIAGYTTITGLPFVPDMNYTYSGNVGRVSNLIWVASYKQLTAAIPSGQSKLYLYALQDGIAFVALGVNSIKDGFSISLKIIYEI